MKGQNWRISAAHEPSAQKAAISQHREFPEDAPPLVVRAYDYASGARQQPHSHARIQLMYSPRGLMRVSTETGAWTLAPMRALWIPAGVTHEVRMVGEISMRSVYLAPQAVPWCWDECCVLTVTPLMRELILMLNDNPGLAETPRQQASGLLLHLLAQATRQNNSLPMPLDRRLRKVCDAILQSPDNNDTLEEWGERIGASSRTLARRMKEETGVTFHHWRLQVRVDEAVCRLVQGVSINEVAQALGYRSSSAFIYMFRSLLGSTPAQYVERILCGAPGVVNEEASAERVGTGSMALAETTRQGAATR
ncbi:AraC family transcriptional regulator [Pseudomonas asplenii]|uniref:AraC family transcriptional regulator n=1 Tax=Pseudomonas asplenii TaxID=53407 RepID=UPI0006CC5FB0|nr:helix-turn-helix transcriptional regulator [Pseudomonas fuscovaginae]KPA94039.1 DNA-binding domain-containing protein, AraC-type [Pseudomonas fuscovaginae]